MGARAFAASVSAPVLALAVSFPVPAHAWTEAHVQSLRAHVDVQPSAQALVALELDVKVRGGWLEGLEVAGLDPDLELVSGKPPWVVSSAGEKFSPDVRVRSGGRVQLRFTRRRAPRRGSYVIGLAYRTDLSHRATELLEDGHVRVLWTLPGWRTGLDAVRVTLTVPEGARMAEGPSGPATETHRHSAGSRTVLTWTRAHLPRTVPWTVAVDVPAMHMDPSVVVPGTVGEAAGRPAQDGSEVAESPPARSRDQAARTPPRVEKSVARPSGEPRRGSSPPAIIALAVLLALFALTKTHVHARAARRLRVGPRPWLTLPHPFARAGLIPTAAAAGAWLWSTVSPDAGLAALALVPLLAVHRTACSPGVPRLGAWTPLGPAHRREARQASRRWRWSSLAWLDVTSPLGWCTLAALGTAILWLDHRDPARSAGAVQGLLLFLPIWLTGGRAQLPAPAHSRLRHLLGVARALRVELSTDGPPLALRPVLHEDSHGGWQDVRIELLGTATPGLIRFDLAMAERRELGGYALEPVLVAVCRRDTPADAALERGWPDVGVQRGPSGRTARIAPWTEQHLKMAVDALAARAARPADVQPLRLAS